MLTCVVLPVTDIRQIDETYRALRQLQREGGHILPEVSDWMDWAEDMLWKEDVCLIGDSSSSKTLTQTLIATFFTSPS